MIRIAEVKISRLFAQLGRDVGGASHRTAVRLGVELALKSETGVVGRGEASPLTGYSRESLAEVEERLARLSPGSLSLPGDPSATRANATALASRFGGGLPSLEAALFFALLDLAGRTARLPALCLMTGPPERVANPFELAALVQGETPETRLQWALDAVRRGFRTLKVKLGPPTQLDEDLRGLRLLRETFGSLVRLRLDANRSYSRDSAGLLLRSVAPLEPEFLEEPTDALQLASLKQSPIPLALDESLQSDETLERLTHQLQPLRIKVLVLKPSSLGILRCMSLATRAKELGLDVVVSHLFDGPVAMAAACCCAGAMGSPHRAQGLAAHPGMQLAPDLEVDGLEGPTLSQSALSGLPWRRTFTCCE